jgi:hypothetical protein
VLADESYVYFYDGWNRLLQVNRRGTAAFAEIEPRITIAGAGEPNAGVPTVSAPTPSATTPIHRRAWALANNGTGLGPWVVHYTYDGLGRLIRKQVPTDSGQAIRSEHFYYDGSRRIQEQVFEPLVLPTGGGGRAASAEQEIVLVEGQSLPGSVLREFVHAPGYVDRLVCVFSGVGATHGGVASSLPLYYVQDASYTVTGLVDVGGAVLEQYRYDPYGRVVQVTNPTPGGWPSAHRRNAVGHQGLFFDRLEAVGPATTGGLGAGGRQLVADPALALSATPTSGNAASPRGLYQNRNRTLDPVLGRFLQRDPNASGQVNASSEWSFGSGPEQPAGLTDLKFRLADGVGLHQYVRSQPTRGLDPSGTIFGLIPTGIGAFLNAHGTLEEARQGIQLFFQVSLMLSEYMINQQLDVHWASDWSQSDDAYSQSGSAAWGAASASGADYSGAEYEDDDGLMYARKLGSPGRPARKAITRMPPHGGPAHWGKIRSEVAALQKQGVHFSKIRVNQGLVDASGTILRTKDGKLLRPDIQYVKNGKIHIVEVRHSQPLNSLKKKRELYEEALGGKLDATRYRIIDAP